jgi:hypothetical protein
MLYMHGNALGVRHAPLDFPSLRAGGYFMMGLVLELYGCTNGAFTLDVQLVLNENLGGILGGTQC